jgi:hypothetical protein
MYRVGDRGGGACLVEEAPDDVLTRRETRVQDLDRRATAEHCVLGHPCGTHSALADLAKDAISTDHKRERDSRYHGRRERCSLDSYEPAVLQHWQPDDPRNRR